MKKDLTRQFQVFAIILTLFSSCPLWAKTFVTSEEVQKLSLELCQEVKKTFQPDLLIGLSRGGIVPLGYFAGDRCFDLQQTRIINVKLYSEENKPKELKFLAPINFEDLKNYKKILVIDELVDTGETLSTVMKLLKEKIPNSEIKSAVLYDKPDNHRHLGKVADFHKEETTDWLVMPWEND